MRHVLTVSAATFLALVPAAGPACADATRAGPSEITIEQTSADSVEWVLVGLRQSGFRIVSVKSTFLGRIRILAENRNYRREIIVSRTTGDIFRDRIVGPANAPGTTPATSAGDGGTTSSSDTQGSGGAAVSIGAEVGGIGVNVEIGGSNDGGGGLGGVVRGITDGLSGG